MDYSDDVDDWCSNCDSLWKTISKLKSTLLEVRKAVDHRRARYEGDGDPGCSSNCIACLIDQWVKP